MQTTQFALDTDDACLARLQGDALAWDDGRQIMVGINDMGKQAETSGLAVLIAHLRLDMHHGLVVLDIEIGSIDIGTSSAEVAIERQRLVEFTRHMQPDIFGDAAIVGIEVTVVPLVTALILARLIGPAIVTAHSQHVLSFFYIRCQVESTGHHTIFAIAQVLAVQIEVCPLANTFKLNEILFRFYILTIYFKCLSIPDNGVC